MARLRSLDADTEQKVEEILAFLQAGRLPSLFVFDLDYTIWPFYLDCSSEPPFHPGHRCYRDRHGIKKIYLDIVPAFVAIKRIPGVKIGIASRSKTPNRAIQVLNLIHLDQETVLMDLIDHTEIQDVSKTIHFDRLRRETLIPYEQMVFFDDDSFNMEEVSPLGVTCCLVDDMFTLEHLQEAVLSFRGRVAEC